MTLPRVLIAICGDPPKPIAAIHGNYLQWFAAALGERVTLCPWVAQDRPVDPDLSEYAGVLLTGSPASLTVPLPWMENAVALVRQAAERDVPVLGICFGHQLIACAFGSPTVAAPSGGEHGSLSISLNDTGLDDPLFAGIPTEFPAHLTHFDHVAPESISSSNGLRVLARSAACPVQALAAGPHIRSVQYHPEFSQSIMDSYRSIEGHGAASQDCQVSSRVFDNWLDHWIFRLTKAT